MDLSEWIEELAEAKEDEAVWEKWKDWRKSQVSTKYVRCSERNILGLRSILHCAG